jgi:hypothetical protein
LNRHYQYRTPEQIKKRLKTRLENKKKARKLPGRAEWKHIFSDNWRDYITNHKILQKYSGEKFTFGIPEGIKWKDYYSKDPFCNIFPQITTALQKEQELLQPIQRPEIDSMTPKHEKKQSDEEYEVGIGTVSFQDRYLEKIVCEIKNHMHLGEWKEALRGLRIFMHYYLKILATHIYLNIRSRSMQVNNRIWNVFTIIKRLTRMRRRGTITACPNPTVAYDILYDSGKTTIKWTATKTRVVEVRINAPNGPLFCRTGHSLDEKTCDWVRNGMTFYLQDVSDGLPLTPENTLARVTANVTKGKRITI